MIDGRVPACVLVLAPHTDDAEFGCGGSIARFAEMDVKVQCVAFSAAEESVPPGLPKDILRTEMRRATGLLGIGDDHVRILSYPVRKFPQHRQEILEDMVALARDLQPDLVLLPSTHDTHQDHQVIAQEGFRAFKKTSILGYEVPWNNLTFVTNCFIMLEARHVQQKLAALKCYYSQLGRDYIDEDFIRSLLRTRGGQVGGTYAEAFEVIRWLVR
jgi:N-acetylglucosamine malate deacetylase 1